MDNYNNDYIQKRDKLLTDVYQVGRTDAILKSDDWKQLEPGIHKAFDALLLETVEAVIDDSPKHPFTLQGYSSDYVSPYELRQKAKELINAGEETE